MNQKAYKKPQHLSKDDRFGQILTQKTSKSIIYPIKIVFLHQIHSIMSRFLFILITLIYPFLNLARKDSHYSYAQLSISEGLSQANVRSILLDQKGNLWVGTKNGLNQYSQQKMENFFHQAVQQCLLFDNGPTRTALDLRRKQTFFLQHQGKEVHYMGPIGWLPFQRNPTKVPEDRKQELHLPMWFARFGTNFPCHPTRSNRKTGNLSGRYDIQWNILCQRYRKPFVRDSLELSFTRTHLWCKEQGYFPKTLVQVHHPKLSERKLLRVV
jgi:hypothetical protein